MNKWIPIVLALLLAQGAQGANKADSKAAAARAAFERMDREDFLDGLEAAEACKRRADFACADARLAGIRELIGSPEQDRLWQLASAAVRDAKLQQQRMIAAHQAEQRRMAQASEENGFQWGKLAAIGAGMALGGVGELDKQAQAELLLGAVRDSMAGEQGMSGLQQAAASTSQRMGGTAGAAGGAAMAPGGGGANWTPEPNTLNGSAACQGYSDANFKQHFAANSKGPDVQLHTMCAAAYNYYSMYLNAKKQGYTKQEAQVTYNAFLDAARVAENFYATTRTN